MFRSRYGIPTPLVVIVVSTVALCLWHVLPSSLQHKILPVVSATNFIVSTADDHNDGTCDVDCTLREAINAVNAGSGGDTISFNISGAGVQTMNLTSGLPVITKSVTIDGTTQPGFSGTPLIELNGTGAGSAEGLSFQASSGGSTVKSLVINRFGLRGISSDVNITVQGCFIGTNATGTAALANGAAGIRLNAGGSTIGGAIAAARNVISGNTTYGIEILSGSNTLQGNYIGTDVTGTTAIGNNVDGIRIQSASNTVGGTAAGTGNLISGNRQNGISMSVNGSNNQVQGNLIGTDSSGLVGLGNGSLSPGTYAGIDIGGSNNTIGGTVPGARNIIAGALVSNNGIRMGGSSNTVQGNYIGTNLTGDASLGAFRTGVTIQGTNNLVGGTSAAARNIISGNGGGAGGFGVDICCSGTATGNQIQGNYIGLRADGAAGLGNHTGGVRIASGNNNNTVGGTAAGAGNVISGNGGGAINLNGTATTNNLIQGNYLGLNPAGTAAIPNSYGVFLESEANGNTIGGTTSAARNVISGNAVANIAITDNNTKDNLVQGNFIGTQADGTTPLGGGRGVYIYFNASNNTIGGTAVGAGNVIAFNADKGVGIDSNAGNGNAVLGNSIFSNGNLGIDLKLDGVTTNDSCDADTGPNNLQNFPIITSVTPGATDTTISGTLNGTASTQFRIEFFASPSCDAAGNGEGKVFLGSTNVTTDGACNGSFMFVVPNASITGPIITATATDPNKNTSEFSACASAVVPKTIQFSTSTLSLGEASLGAVLTVNRLGDTSAPATVRYATGDAAGTNNCNVFNGSASSRCDYLITLGTLRFAANEPSKTITIPIIDDSYAEGSENFTIALSNPTGGAVGSPDTVTVTITDNEAMTGPNPIDQTNFLVRLHYLDFLNREPDTGGFNFWTGQIDNCTPKPQCTEVSRINVSASFFLSIEFQQTGYLVERFYKVAYGDATGTSTLNGPHQLSVPIVRLLEFLADTQRIGQGVVVLQPGWEQLLESNKQAYAQEFVQTTRFSSAFPTSMTPAQFVDQLNQRAGNVLSASERATAINLFGGAGDSSNTTARAQAVRQVADDTDLYNAEFNRAFVLAEYFGYLRRNPDDPQDADYTGYDFWLTKLNQFNGNYLNAEMVKAFLSSIEYRQRFGP